MDKFTFDWDELAFASKKDLRALKATFIAAPREISARRFTELVKSYLPQGNIVVGLAKEEYIDGFAGQPHFRVLQQTAVELVIKKVNASKSSHKIYALSYHQRDVKHIYEKISFRRVVLVNGSWKSSFHTRPEYYALVTNKLPFELVSAFTDEKEAKAYDVKLKKELDKLCPVTPNKGTFTEEQMLARADEISCRSYDYCFQTGAALGKKSGSRYKELIAEWNHIVPYETFAMHFGSVREKNFSPPGDLNFYDTVHAEVELVIEAQKRRVNLAGTTVFINLLPCPTCARMFCETDIAELVYKHDHSEGYAVAMLEAAGKKVRRVVELEGTL